MVTCMETYLTIIDVKWGNKKINKMLENHENAHSVKMAHMSRYNENL